MSTSTALTPLPAIHSARLPATYVKAKDALEKCSRIDECKDWADKAAALASYAKQSKDDALRQMADRIQARAIRRCGELLKRIEPKHTGRPEKNSTGAGTNFTRKNAAAHAGLSKRQKDTALQVAAVPAADFEAAVESSSPPSVTELAARGTKKKNDAPAWAAKIAAEGRPPGFAKATAAIGTLRRFAEFCTENDPLVIAGAVLPHEAAETRAHVKTIDHWLDKFVTHIGG